MHSRNRTQSAGDLLHLLCAVHSQVRRGHSDILLLPQARGETAKGASPIQNRMEAASSRGGELRLRESRNCEEEAGGTTESRVTEGDGGKVENRENPRRGAEASVGAGSPAPGPMEP